MAGSKTGRSRKTSGKKRGKGTKSGGGAALLTPEQQGDVLGVGLLALALLTALSLVPVGLFGPNAFDLFPSGNPVGQVGGAIRGVLTWVLGPAVAALVPVLLVLGGVAAGGWGSRRWALRLALLVTGLGLLLPPGLHVLVADPAMAGAYGRTVGEPLVAALGWLGSLVLLATLLVVLCVLTLRWNPLRSLGGALAQGGRSAAERLREARERVAEAGGPFGPSPGGTDVSEPGDLPFEREGADQPGPGEAVSPPSGPAAAGLAQPPAPPRAATRSVPAGVDPAALADPIDPARLSDEERPPLDLLQTEDKADRRDMERELDRLGEVLVEKLRTFNVQSALSGRTTGPVVTQFEVVPAAGVKVNRIANLDADLALAMRAPSVRIVAPIPGKGAVGVEIPNPEPQMVRLRSILEAATFQRARGSLPLGLGEDLTGRPYVADLARMPHVLIAGATGSGKSVCINTIITSLVYRHTPETLRMLMIDPKMVELSAYQDLPHLRHPVVTDPQDAAGVLKWAVLEMERRYQLLSANGVRSIAEFNRRVKEGVTIRRVEARGEEGDEDRWIWDEGVLPYVVVVVDELADLMMQVQSEIEKPLAQLAQKARAIGIHLIVATQRPSVNVITGLIKANFPTRVAFRVASKTDSRTILDQNGAEALLGNGDMLFLPPGQSEPIRIQGAFIDTEETDRLLSWFRARQDALDAERAGGAPAVERDILDEVRASEQVDASDIVEEVMEDWDELFRAAAEVCITQDQGSTSLLQRRLKIGYGRAARIVDQLHEAGIVGPPDGSKPRDVLVGLDALDLIMSGGRE